MADYWAERTAKAQAKLTDKTIAETEKQLVKYYSSSQQKIIGQFEKTYKKVFSKIAEGEEVTPADLYKLDTYWQMQGQLKQELQKLGDKQAELFSKKFIQEYQDIYDGISIPGEAMFSSVDKQAAQQMINQIWCADGKSWSSRIWTNTDKLQQALNDNLIDCVLTGKKPSELKSLLQKEFGASYNRADTVVRTEMAHIQTQAAKDRYFKSGITEVEVWADEDERRCEQCGKLHKKRYKVTEDAPIPAHPRCRCTIIPIIENDKTVEFLAQGSYNGYEPCFKDKINFEKDRNVKKAIKNSTANFVRDIEPTNLEEYKEVMYGVFIDRVPSIQGFYDIKAHGSYNSIKLFTKPANAETVAKILQLRKDYQQGTPIRLLCCSTGKMTDGTCFAQDLANMLGVDVIAPDTVIFADENGVLKKGRFEKFERKDFKHFTPKR